MSSLLSKLSISLPEKLEKLEWSSDYTKLAAGASIAAIVGYALYKRKQENSKLPLPPGFPKKPFIGNLWDMPKEFEWVTFREWSKILSTSFFSWFSPVLWLTSSIRIDSDIIHADVSGQIVVVLNSAQAATDLLDKRASIYSSRPRFPMVNEL